MVDENQGLTQRNLPEIAKSEQTISKINNYLHRL